MGKVVKDYTVKSTHILNFNMLLLRVTKNKTAKIQRMFEKPHKYVSYTVFRFKYNWSYIKLL